MRWSASVGRACALAGTVTLVAPFLAAQQGKAPPGPGRVEGVAVDMFGAPLRDAEVWLVNQRERTVRTDAEGRFAFDRVPLGYQWARVRARGLHRASGRVHVTDDAPLQFTHLVALPAADLDVRVVDAQGAPVAGADVIASRT